MKYFLIGRPNVGKTSIFNKLTISKNIIHREEGTTRDWHKSKIIGLNHSIIYDSPGVIFTNKKLKKINFSKLLQTINVFLYVIDLKNKNDYYDKESINELRKYNKKIILIINKDDNYEQNLIISKSGYDNLFYISCSHNLGFDKLYTYFENNDWELKMIMFLIIR